MKWDHDQVRDLLDAEIEVGEANDGSGLHVARFSDNLMKYELWIIEKMGSVFLAADPELPLQGLPLFEVSLPCAELAPVERGGMPTGLGIFEALDHGSTLSFTITRRKNGTISLSGAYERGHITR
jgi:hypothetical protein